MIKIFHAYIFWLLKIIIWIVFIGFILDSSNQKAAPRGIFYNYQTVCYQIKEYTHKLASN